MDTFASTAAGGCWDRKQYPDDATGHAVTPVVFPLSIPQCNLFNRLPKHMAQPPPLPPVDRQCPSLPAPVVRSASDGTEVCRVEASSRLCQRPRLVLSSLLFSRSLSPAGETQRQAGICAFLWLVIISKLSRLTAWASLTPQLLAHSWTCAARQLTLNMFPYSDPGSTISLPVFMSICADYIHQRTTTELLFFSR